MCGIAGLLKYSGLPSDFQKLSDQLLAGIVRRGPDGHGVFEQGCCILLHSRLAITDQTELAHQPMVFGQFTISFNGEIYNTKELIDRYFTDEEFNSTSDTEIILKLFAKIGERVFSELEGIFAIALWDQLTHTLWLVRDHLGIKPLYYFQGDIFAFSSSAKSLAQVFSAQELDQKSLSDFQSFGCVIGPRTIYQQIKSVPAGCYLKYRQGGDVELVKYSHIFSLVKKQGKLNIPQTLLEVVESQVPDKVEFGIFLSAGIDSNLIAGACRELGRKFHTFSIGFESKRRGVESEAVVARKMATYWGSQHHEWIVKKSEVPELFDEFLDSMDQPTTDGFNIFLASKLAANYCPVVLSGVGADELFLGYWHFRHLNNWKRLNGRVGLRFLFKLAEFLKDIYPVKGLLHRFGYSFLQDSKVQNDLHQAYLFYRSQGGDVSSDELSELFQDQDLTFWQKVSIAELFFYTQHKLLRDTDNFSMNFGLEVRVPFLDQRFISAGLQYLAQINDFNFEQQYPKRLLLSVLQNFCPEFSNYKKQGFELPLSSWFDMSDEEFVKSCKKTIITRF